MDAAALQQWLLEKISNRLGVPPSSVNVRTRFNACGITSLSAMSLLSELSVLLGRTLPSTLMWDHPTIESLVAHLADGVEREVPGPAAVTDTTREPIAIVGVACRFPRAESPDGLWRVLRDGVDAITEVPSDRWLLDEFFDLDVTKAGKMATRWGGFIAGIDRFDPAFFGIAPVEAAQMDPQQRLMLELSWEALEDAGVVIERLRGGRTGVFFGAIWNDYATLQRQSGTAAITPHSATGSHYSIIANRVSYSLGLQGPSMVIDTACSSSLVAVHLACRSLRSGECDMALAGGVNLIAAPDSTVAMSKFGGMAADGRCKAFDARANGYVRGEGGGVVVLKRLSSALRAGDHTMALIRGSAVNNDGYSNGLTAPNPAAQAAVLEAAYADAGVAHECVDYVETHGTGTLLGDPIEATALGAVLGRGRSPAHPLRIGSIKTNIGHTEAAAGIAGLIKVTLSMAHRQLPPSLHFQTPNPHIPFDALRLKVQDVLSPWGATGTQPVFAGVSSFGFGGTNAHVVLESHGQVDSHLLALSAADDGALERAVEALIPLVDTTPIETLCAAVSEGAAEGPASLAVTFGTRQELSDRLAAVRRGEAVIPGVARRNDRVPGGLVFVFPGQGGHWPGMGRSLLATEPAFRSAFLRCERALQPFTDWLPIDVLLDTESPLWSRIDVVQPMIWAIQVSLAALFRRFGLVPSAVVGHSMGEIAAAQVAGILSLEDAARLIARRSRLLRRVSGRGAMVGVELSPDRALQAIAGYTDHVAVATHNAPGFVALSGDPDALRTITEQLMAARIPCHRLRVDVASHSPQMDPLLEDLRTALDGLAPADGTVAFMSSVDVGWTPGRALGPDYWCRNLREPVRFADAVTAVAAAGHTSFVELSPHPMLTAAIGECLGAAGVEGRALPSLHRDHGERRTVLDTLGVLHAEGRVLQWPAIVAASEPRLRLPDGISSESPRPGARAYLLPLSARTPEALQALARAMTSLVATGPSTLADICHAASVRRDHHDHRLAIVDDSRQGMADTLAKLGAGVDVAGAVRGCRPPAGVPGVVFVFGEVGASLPEAARRLMAEETAFRDAVAACDRVVRDTAGWSLAAVLDDTVPPRAEATATLTLAYFRGFAALYRTVGIAPGGAAGAGLGAVAAACVAGAIDWDVALRLAARGDRRLLAPIPPLAELASRPATMPLVVLDRHAAGVEGLVRDGFGTFSCFGSLDPPLGGGSSTSLTVVPSGAGRADVLRALARFYTLGHAVDFAALHPDAGRPVRLPSYPWQRERYWFTDFLERDGEVHPLLERRHESALGPLSFEGRISPRRPAYLVDHTLLDRIVVPAVLYLEGILAALRTTLTETAALNLADVVFHEALIVSPEEQRAMQIIFAAAPEGRRFQLLNRSIGGDGVGAWTLSVSGRVGGSPRDAAPVDLAAVRARLEPFPATTFYEQFWRNGGQLGPAFRVVQQIFRRPGEILARIALPEGVAIPEGHVIHPALLDSGFHLPNLLAIIAGEDMLHVPIGVAGIRVPGPIPPGDLWCRLIVPDTGSVPESFLVDFSLLDGEGAPVVAVDGLRMKRMRRDAWSRAEQRSDLDEWLHSPAWVAVTAPAGGAVRGRRWLVLPEREAMGAALAEALTARGDVAVVADSDFDGTTVEGCRTLLDRALEGGALFGVLYVPAVPAADVDGGDFALPPAALGVLLHLGQTMGQAASGARLWLVTQGAWSVADDGHRPDPGLSALWGLARTMALEHPDLWGGAVDVDPGVRGDRERAAELIPALDVAGEDQLALRGGTIHAARVLGRPSRAVPAWRAGDEGTWLVTGGSSAVGVLLTRWLVERGVRSLVLLSRSGAGEAQLSSIRDAGANVVVATADVGDYAALTMALSRTLPDLPPVVGVVHAAGVIEDAALTQLSRGHLSRTWAAKAAGAWNLHRVTRGMPIRHFVLFSSAVGLMGSLGQGAYAAANAFLDGLAQRRRADELPARSLDWGPWAATGMMASSGEAASRAWTARGIALMPPEIGVRLFDHVFGEGTAAQLAPLAIDWEQWSRVTPARSSLAAGRRRASSPGPSTPSAEWQTLCTELEAAPPAQREQLALAFARKEVGRTLGFAKDQPIDPQRGFFELGMDSMMAVTFRTALETTLGRPLSQTLAFDHPNLAALARFLIAEAGNGREALHPEPTPAPAIGAPVVTRDAARTASTRHDAEPLAIIGMGCRFPGGVVDAESFWSLLDNGVDAIGEVPRDRWDIDAYFDPDPRTPGKTYTRWGGFLDRIEDFDASFFGISPREATSMDPQQRLLLEVTWEALEDAGISPPSLAGSQTGVFVGLATDDFSQVQLRCGDTRTIDAYSFTGTAYSAAGGRLSFHLGLRGPNLSIDTACSSSLVATHVACQSLRSGESDLAIVGGVNAMLSPELFVYFSKLRAMAKDGRCKTFDASADGYVRGEGCGVIVLRRLSDAEARGERILGLVRGSAVAHDGHSGGLTVPNGTAQQAVIRQALANGRVLPSQVDYVQAHGTGTSLGDPIEANALGAVLREGRTPEHPLYLGSVKTNIGHTEAAAGLAGLMTVLLAMRHERIPSHLHFNELNPRITLADVPAMIPKASVPWSRRNGGSRVGGVSSFGFSGTNAHVVLEEAQPRPVPAPNGQSWRIVHLATRCAASLATSVERLASFIEPAPRCDARRHRHERQPGTAGVRGAAGCRRALHRSVAAAAPGCRGRTNAGRNLPGSSPGGAGSAGVPVYGTGGAGSWHGSGSLRERSCLSHGARSVRRAAAAAAGPVCRRPDARAGWRNVGVAPDAVHAAMPVRVRVCARGVMAGLGDRAWRSDRAQPGRDCGGLCGRRDVAGRCASSGRGAGPADAGTARGRRHGGGGRFRGARRGVARSTRGPTDDRRA